MANGRAASAGESDRAKTSSGSEGSSRQAHSMCTTQTRNLQSAIGSGALPDPRFGQPDFRELRCAQIGFVRAEEFVELWWRDLRSGKHRVRLSAMVDLVLEEMREEPGCALLHDAGT